MSEEVNISAWWMPLKILYLYEKWMENRDNPSSRKYLMDMYLYLTSQQMIRLISDLKSVYLIPPDYVKPTEMNDLIQIHNNIQKDYPQIYFEQEKVGKLNYEMDLSMYPAKIQPCLKGIIYNLEKRDDNIFYWIRKLCDYEFSDWFNGEKKKKFEYNYQYLKIVWEILYRFIDQNSEYEFIRRTICALQKFYKKMGHKEKPIYLYHAVLLIVRSKEIDRNSKPPEIDTSIVDVEKLYKDHLSGGKLEIDDYVLDLHTRKMKWSPHCYEKFAMEGAFIKNENDRFLNKEYREIYNLLKKELDLYKSREGTIH